jgi:hypothetical protein
MNIYDLYGVNTSSLDEANELVGKILRLSLEPHDSYFLGLYWYLECPDGARVTLQHNIDAMDDEVLMPEYQDWPFLLYINRHPDADELKETLSTADARIQHLERDVLP